MKVSTRLQTRQGKEGKRYPKMNEYPPSNNQERLFLSPCNYNQKLRAQMYKTLKEMKQDLIKIRRQMKGKATHRCRNENKLESLME